MSDRPLRSGTTGYQFTDPDRDPPEIDWEAATLRSKDEKRVFMEVVGQRLEREREAHEQARRDGEPPTRSSFL